MENKSLKPKIRFKGFTEAWEQRKLDEFGISTSGTSIESEFGEGEKYKVISIGSYSENSTYNDQGIRAKLSDKTKKRVLNKGDLTMILNDKTSSGRIIGRVLIIDKSDMYVFNQRTQRIEPYHDKYDAIFLYEMLNAPQIRNKIFKQSQGNTQIYVNWSTIKELEYLIPNIEEQIKLGHMFKQLDNLITLHQRKCDKLVNIKKSLLEKMFPKNGNNVPEIRFKGFTEAWEQRKLGEVYKFQYGEFNNNPSNGGIYPVFGANGIIGGYTNYNAENSVIIGHMGEYAGSVLWGNGKHFVTYNGTISKPKGENVVSKFGYYMLYQKDINKICGGSGLPFLSYEQLNKIEVCYPKDIKEQKSIANYLTNIDNLITLHQKKLNKLKNIKKSLLEKMFV